jgi:hypothetical protein
MRVLTSQGAKSESGANPFVFDPSKEKVEGPSFMDRVASPIDAYYGKLPGQNPVAPPIGNTRADALAAKYNNPAK